MSHCLPKIKAKKALDFWKKYLGQTMTNSSPVKLSIQTAGESLVFNLQSYNILCQTRVFDSKSDTFRKICSIR